MRHITSKTPGTIAALAGVKIPRNLRRALYPSAELYRVTPMFPDTKDNANNVAGPMTYVIDGHIENAVIVRVPVSTTMREAADIEAAIVADTKRPVLVITSNIELLKVERLQPEEINRILVGGEPVIEDEADDAPTDSEGTVQ